MPWTGSVFVDPELARQFLQSLQENLGLVNLDFSAENSYFKVDDETLSIFCEAVIDHPTLQHLGLQTTNWNGVCGDDTPDPTSREAISLRTQYVANLLRVNKVIQTIEFTPSEGDEQLMNNKVIPRLEVNRHRSRVRALRRTEGSLRPQLWGAPPTHPSEWTIPWSRRDARTTT